MTTHTMTTHDTTHDDTTTPWPARTTVAQRAVLAYVASHPGCCTMDVVRYEWGGRRGHSATYDRVDRLVRRGLLVRHRAARGRVALYAC